MKETLNDRFISFLTQLPSVEAIDALELQPDASDKKRADFLVESRKVIVELKSLECGPEQKVHDEIDKHRNRPEFPLFYGEMEVHKILKHLPNGDVIMRKLLEKISRSIEQGFRSANKQIGSTKSIFECPNAAGLLVLLNEDLSVLSPEVISRKVSQLLMRKDHDGSFHYKHVTSVWLLCENYTLKNQGTKKLQPSVVIDGPFAEGKNEFEAILDDIQRAWAAYNRIPFLKANATRISDSDFMPLAELEKQQEPFKPRHEIWRQRYRNNPYLRSLADDAVMSHGAKFISLMTPSFIKEGSKLPTEKMAQFLEGWTHFLEEAHFRGLDLRKVPELAVDAE